MAWTPTDEMLAKTRRVGGRRADEQLTRRRPGAGRTVVRSARFDEAEADALRAAAMASDQSVAEFIRAATLAAMPADLASPEAAAA